MAYHEFFQKKTMLLLGAEGIGRRHIKDTLMARHPNEVAYPKRHTSRPPRSEELEANKGTKPAFYFCTLEEMVADIRAGKYLQYGNYGGHLYGIKIETIAAIHSEGRTAIVDVEPAALDVLGVLSQPEFAAYVVFLAPPPVCMNTDDDGAVAATELESEQLWRKYGLYYDLTIFNRDVEHTIGVLEFVLERLRAGRPLPPRWHRGLEPELGTSSRLDHTDDDDEPKKSLYGLCCVK